MIDACKRPAIALICAAVAFGQNSDVRSLITNTPEVAAAIRVFESLVQAQVSEQQIPGVVVGLVHDQSLVWAKGFGYSDVEHKTALTQKTLFRMASNTKPFTATAIVQLRDDGQLRLDDPVSQYLPWLKGQPLSPDDGSRPISVADLITHASGLPREAAFSYWNTRTFPTKAELLAALPNQKPAFRPETRVKYSNLGFVLAGMVVEAVTRKPYAEYIDSKILQPLGMSASSIDQNVAELASGYGRRRPDSSREKIGFIETRAIAPAAGLTSNIEDLARFLSLQFRDGRSGGAQILSGQSLREMHRVHFVDSNWKSGVGLGFAIRRMNDRTYVGHSGRISGYSTHISFLPESKFGVIVLINADDGRPEQIAARAHEIVGPAITGAFPPSKREWKESWRRYAGHYRSDIEDVYVVALKDELILMDTASPDPVNGAFHVVAQSNGSFLLEGPNWGWEIGETVQFIEKGATINGLMLGTYKFERVE